MAHPLPPELLDGIACFIDTRRDVIAFALACRTFYKIACPRHSEYRTLRASYADVGVWKHLRERLDLAAGIRVVHVLEQARVQDVEPRMSSHPCTPRVCRAGAVPIPYTTKGDALGAIANALGSMPLLESFTWSFPLVLRHESCRLGAAAVWAAAAKLPGLRNLVIVQPLNPPGQYPVYTGGIERYPLWSIGGLSSISLINVAFLRHADSVAMFARVLEQSPALETLHVVLYDWDFNFARFLGKATLQRLRKINLEVYMDEEYNAEVLATLFERTPSLEDVEWQYTPIRTLAPGSLPRLKRLVSAYDLGVPELLADKSLPPRRLEMLGGFQLHSGCLAQLAFIDKYALTRLELTRFASMDLLVEVVRALPALRWLRVPSVDYMRDWRRATCELIPLGEWAHVLAYAQQLEVFHGPPFFKDPGLDREYNDARAREIADFAPALRRVDHWTMAPDRAVLIERDGRWREVTVVDD